MRDLGARWIPPSSYGFRGLRASKGAFFPIGFTGSRVRIPLSRPLGNKAVSGRPKIEEAPQEPAGPLPGAETPRERQRPDARTGI